MDTSILNFVIEEMQPLSIVDKPSFINLVRLGCSKKITIMSSKTLKNKIKTMHGEMETSLCDTLEKVSVVTVAADLWSKAKRSYLGMKVHWIDEKSLERKSAVLACHRVTGRHTYDVLAREINAIFLKYKIQNKVSYMITDNGSNFVKAFKVYQARENEQESESDEFIASDDENENDEIEVHCLDEILINSNDEFECDIILPPHHRCSSHTLNLVATTDTEIALENKAYKKIFRSTFAKCNSLWYKQNKSTIVADKVHDLINVYLKTPNATRWNSTFDAMVHLGEILEKNKENLNTCFDFCKLLRLTDDEVLFIKEYCKVMKPLARALDVLQAEKNMFMGYLLPVLYQLKSSLQSIANEGLNRCDPLVKCIEAGIDKRFKEVLQNSDFEIASCLHPKFRFDWLPSDKQIAAEMNLKELYLKSFCSANDSSTESLKSENDNNSIEDDFFTFQVSKSSETNLQEFYDYKKSVKSKSQLSVLENFPKIKKLFIQYNTAIPSSASVERLFSSASLILRDKRNRLKDEIFEILLKLKLNNKTY